MNSNTIHLLSSVCPNSTTDYTNLDSPDAIIVQAPAWGVQTPPLSLASLSAYARRAGYKILPLDLNIEFYSIRPDKFSAMWGLEESQWFWLTKDCVDEFIEAYKNKIDEFIDLILSTNAPLVGFTLYISSMYFSLHLIEKIKARRPSIKIIVGGPHAHKFMAGKELAANLLIDAVVQSEGEVALVDLISRTRQEGSFLDCSGILISNNGAVQETPTRQMIQSLDSLPIPDFSDFSFGPYVEPNRLPMASSRGCPNKCIFCNEQPYWESYRFRSGESMIEEVKHQLMLYPNISFVDFHDSICNGKMSAITKFAEGLLRNKIKIRWCGQAVIRKEMTEEVMVYLKHSGCVCMAYGLETSNQALMQSVGKLLSKGADIDKIAEAHSKSGLNAVYNVMFGLPGETEEDAFACLEFLRRNINNNLTVNPSAGFCGFADGTRGWENPNQFGIDKTLGGSFWSSLDGTNTFLIRLKRFEDFCRVVAELGIRTTYSATHLLNRNQVIAKYYIALGQPEKAIHYYREWSKEHPNDSQAIEFLLTHPDITYTNPSAFAISSCSDYNWLNGVSRSWGPAILFPHSPTVSEVLVVGKTVELVTNERRKIIDVRRYPDRNSIEIFVTGDLLDGDQVGWPNLLKIVENSIIPILSV